ncbi:MAG: redoxin domain-containing protein [Deferribacteres bacterium]|nr:redoxin domain-containing protein [candidate division KSB1 bacterium]MCB9509620.1 redoxin domain-containing protein [Deferribacteres bacterium]
MELHQKKAEFDSRNVQIVGVSVDPIEKAKAMAERTKTDFTFLSDIGGQLIEYFKIWHHRSNKHDIAIASSFLFAKSGQLIWQNITDNYKIRPRPEEILAAIDHHHKKEKP